MPRVVNYADRFEGLREAVYTVTLSQGAEAVSVETVAEKLCMSGTSVRRLLSEPTVLPSLGLDWIARLRRQRRFADPRASADIDARWSTVVTPLLWLIPRTDDERDQETVWNALVDAHPRALWALEAVSERQLTRASYVDRALPVGLPADVRHYEYLRLYALVVGAGDSVAAGAMRPEEAMHAVRRHLDDLYPAWLVLAADGAA
jgi:hypothetical protein